MKYILLATLLLCGCANSEPVNVQGTVELEGIETSKGQALVEIGDFEVLYVYGSENGEVKYLEPMSVMQGKHIVRDWYIDQSYIQDSVKVINEELSK